MELEGQKALIKLECKAIENLVEEPKKLEQRIDETMQKLQQVVAKHLCCRFPELLLNALKFTDQQKRKFHKSHGNQKGKGLRVSKDEVRKLCVRLNETGFLSSLIIRFCHKEKCIKRQPMMHT